MKFIAKCIIHEKKNYSEFIHNKKKIENNSGLNLGIFFNT
jgi:hypothetical protein